MGEEIRQVLLGSYASMSEALVVQNVLDAAGVWCRAGDLAGVPTHLFGLLGNVGRSAGVWVRAADVEQATALLARVGAADEEAVAAEALAATPPPEVLPSPAPDLIRAPGARARGGAASGLALAGFVVVAGLVLARGCAGGG
jgi:hypothetical protein